jgi:hypothetical protein
VRWLLYAHVTVLATLIPDLCKWLPLARLLQLFTPPPSRGWYRGLTAGEIVTAVTWRLRRPWRMRGRRCLRQGLLTLHFLRLAGLPAVLNFAVYCRPSAREKAHCWVTLHGQPLTEPPQAQYVLVLVHGAGP